MKFSSFSIILIFVLLSIIGFSLISLISVQLNPTQESPEMTVIYTWPDAAPETIEREITSKLEGAFSRIKGVAQVKSVTSQNSGRITLQLDSEEDIDYLRFEVASVIRRVYPSLPQEASYPRLNKSYLSEDEVQTPILTYALTGDKIPYEIQRYAEEQIKNQVSMINGVNQVSVYGATPMEWRINYDFDLLNENGLSYNDILNAIRTYLDLKALGNGTYVNSNEELNTVNIILNNKAGEIDWKNLPIGANGNKIVYLKDVANVAKSEEQPQSYFRINGKNRINLAIYAEKGTNHLEVAKDVKTAIQNIKAQLPEGYQLIKDQDSTEYITKELDKLKFRATLSIAILMLLILLMIRNFRYLLVLLISILANIGLAFIFYYLLKVEIQLYSLAGIAISLGIIIDNSIIMIDHIRHQSNRRIFLALLASTLTTMASLAVIFFLPEQLKLNLTDFAKVIIINLGASLLIALFLIPALSEKLPVRKKTNRSSIRRKRIIARLSYAYYLTINKILRFRKLALTLAILAFGVPLFLLPLRMNNENWYDTLYNNTFGNEWYIDNLKPHLDKFTGGTFRLFSQFVYENAYYNEPERTKLYVLATMPPGSTVEQMNKVFIQVEKYLGNIKGIDEYITQVYSGQQAFMNISFDSTFEKGSFPHLLKSRLSAHALDIGGVKWNIFGVGQGFSNAYGSGGALSYSTVLMGYNYYELFKQADYFKKRLQENPRVKEVDIHADYKRKPDDLYEFRLLFDKEKIAEKGLSISEIFGQLKKLSKTRFADIREIIDGEIIAVTVTTAKSENFDIWHLLNVPIKIGGKQFKLSEITSIQKEKVSSDIYKADQQYIRTVKSNYLGMPKFGSKHLNSVIEEANNSMPLGYKAEKKRYAWGGDEESVQYWSIILVIVLIFFICSILFESLSQPLAIIGIIPLSFIGIFLTFYWFDINFDQGGYASFLLIAGITVNAGILIINEYNNLPEKRFKSNVQRYLKAFSHKITPVFLTTFSTAAGLIPFLIGTQEPFWYAFACGVIGGLAVSLFVVLFYLPVFLLRRQKE